LIATFQTITTLIYTLQPSIRQNSDDVPSDSHGTLAGNLATQDLRYLTALAILLVREHEVIAVVTTKPQGYETLEVLATCDTNQRSQLEAGVDHQFLAMRNPRDDDPDFESPRPNRPVELDTFLKEPAEDPPFKVIYSKQPNLNLTDPLSNVLELG
jgi:hypothetical protein